MNSGVQYVSQWNHHKKKREKKRRVSPTETYRSAKNQPRHWRQATPSIPNSFLGFLSAKWRTHLLASDEHQHRIQFLNAVRTFWVINMDENMELDYLPRLKWFGWWMWMCKWTVATIWNYILCNSATCAPKSLISKMIMFKFEIVGLLSGDGR